MEKVAERRRMGRREKWGEGTARRRALDPGESARGLVGSTESRMVGDRPSSEWWEEGE